MARAIEANFPVGESYYRYSDEAGMPAGTYPLEIERIRTLTSKRAALLDRLFNERRKAGAAAGIAPVDVPADASAVIRPGIYDRSCAGWRLGPVFAYGVRSGNGCRGQVGPLSDESRVLSAFGEGIPTAPCGCPSLPDGVPRASGTFLRGGAIRLRRRSSLRFLTCPKKSLPLEPPRNLKLKNTDQTFPLRWVPSLYFAMGLPFVVLNMVSAVMFKDLGISDAQIAFWTSLIMWPWTIKFLWSPFLELYKTKKYWVVATQLLSGAMFGLAALALHLPSFFAVTVALFAVVAFSGATHDIAADGVYMAELSTEAQAKYIGWQGAFYNLAKLVATGGLVWLAGWLYERFSAEGQSVFDAGVQAWTAILAILCLTLAALGCYHARRLPSGGGAASGSSLRDGLSGLKEVIAAFFAKKHIRYYIAFIILYRLGEGFVMKIVPLFLKADTAAGGLGLTNQQIGLYYGTFGAGAFLLGSLLAGYYIAGRGLRRTLFTLCCIFNLPFAVYALLAWFQPQSMWLVGGGIVVEYFGYGFGFVGLTLFMMQQVAPGRHQMAHYAFASGIMNLSVMLTGAVSGYLSDALGYGTFFIAVMLATVPAFLVTRFVPFTYDDKPTTEQK